MRTTISVISLLLAMCLLWLSAHDVYVSRVNQQQQQLILELQQGTHDLSWSLDEPAELVTGFGHGWQWWSEDLRVNSQKSAISLAFGEQFLVPHLHQQLSFYWQSAQANQESAQLLLEFSRVDLGTFYYAPLIDLNNGINTIDLAALRWTAKHKGENSLVSWSSLPALNTLVWRFSMPDKQVGSALLRDVKIHQSQPLMMANDGQLLTGVLNNQLRPQWQSQRFDMPSPPVMQSHLSLSPWLFFIVAIVILMGVIMGYQQPKQLNQRLVNKQGPLLLVVLVAVVAWAMQTKPLFAMFENYPWLPTILFVLPTVFLIKRWLLPKSAAWAIWLITLLTAVVLFGLSDYRLSFIKDLPLYVLWAISQQVILGPLVSDFLHHKAGFSPLYVALICGVLFALLHLPNQMLMAATFVGGVLWSYAWLRYQNIYANAISHALLALLFYQTMPPHLLGSARVGLWF